MKKHGWRVLFYKVCPEVQAYTYLRSVEPWESKTQNGWYRTPTTFPPVEFKTRKAAVAALISMLDSRTEYEPSMSDWNRTWNRKIGNVLRFMLESPSGRRELIDLVQEQRKTRV